MEQEIPSMPNLGGPEAAAIEAAAVMGALIGALIGTLVGIAILAVIIMLIQKHYEAIPSEHREFNPPGKTWMLLIPLFNFYWAFIVYPGLGRSYRKAFAAKGITDVGDAGEKLGLWLAISSIASIIPLVNVIAGIACLVLFIMFLVKMADQKKRLLGAG